MSVIKVYFHKKGSIEVIAEFHSECLLALCKPAIYQEAKLRGTRVAFREHRVVNFDSKINEDEENKKVVGKAKPKESKI